VLPYGRQTIDADDIAAVVAALESPMLTGGPLVANFEAALGAAVGAPHVIACSSGTAALHLAYAALGIGPGDEIITTPITFSATAAAAYYVGATVRIADVDPVTGNLDPASVEGLVTARTRAIVPVHLAGMPVELDAIHAIARAHGLRVVEDACHALGATYRGAPIGSHAASDAIVYSFHPVKHVTTGEGGAVVVHDAALAERVARLRSHGIERDAAKFVGPAEGPWSYEVQELGWNYRLDDIACALGVSQLAKLPRFVARRRELAAQYDRALAGIDGVVTPARFGDRESALHIYAAAIDFDRFGTTRARVMAQLGAAGVGTQVHYIPLLQHPLHAARCPAADRTRARPGAARYYARTLSLPLFPAMTDDDVARVASALTTALGVSR
jgi:UDP-4-amino-4,6-dideoxy-N-acetyl-beta-L-altrosamine transaminase